MKEIKNWVLIFRYTIFKNFHNLTDVNFIQILIEPSDGYQNSNEASKAIIGEVQRRVLSLQLDFAEGVPLKITDK